MTKDYRKVTLESGENVRVHRLRAEKALGRPLPPKAVVHHADGTKRDDAQLVVCENQAYHMLLHSRMRIKAAGGTPNTDAICGHCGLIKPREQFSKASRNGDGIFGWCRACKAEGDRQSYLQRKAVRGPYWRKSVA